MEVFKDLTPFLPRTATSSSMQNVVDELNTPVLDRKEGFDFTEYASVSPQQSESSFNFKIKNEPSELHAINVNNKYSVVLKEDQINNNMNIMNESDMLMNLNQQKEGSSGSNTMLFSPACSSDVADEYYYPSVKENPTTIDDDVFTTITMEDIMMNLNNESPQDCNNVIAKDKQDYVYDTPEDSNNSSVLSTSTNKTPTKPLHLDFSTKFLESADTLSTPDVIKVISDYDKKFNILNIVNEEDISTLSDNLQQNESSVQSPESVFDFTVRSPPLNETFEDKKRGKLSNKVSRKRKTSESDEDYVPPSKKSSKAPRRRKTSYNTDSESEEEEEEYTPKRGRPSKRYASTESDYSKDLDAQRYRELRDKNNEASRRSRLKRKMKEQSLEKEADELEMRNVKLKAQVEQLENLVKNFRSNLFSIIVK